MTINSLLDTIEYLMNQGEGINANTTIKVHLTPNSKGYTPQAIGYAENTDTLGLILKVNRPCDNDNDNGEEIEL